MSYQFPKYLYKYLKADDHLNSLIANSELWFSNPSIFNDPFDCYPYMVHEVPEEGLLEFLKQYKKLINTEIDVNRLNEFVKSNPSVLNGFREVFTEMLKEIGVCCLSENSVNLLLWAHYADCHRGVCLQFETTELAANFGYIKNIEYRREAPTVTLFNGITSAWASASFVKSMDWSYEREVRIQQEKAGAYKFKKIALKKIIFGLKTDSQIISNTIDLILNNKYIDVQFLKAEMSSNEYTLAYFPIKKT